MTAAERALAERRQQELPERITDPATIARIARLVRAVAAGSAEQGHDVARDAG